MSELSRVNPVGAGGSGVSAHAQAAASGTVDPAVLDEIIRRIVEVADPEKIILFGSAARGEMNDHSDVDLLIIKEGGRPLATMREIYKKLRGVMMAVDAIVVSPAHVKRHKDTHALVIKPALREGRVVYEANFGPNLPSGDLPLTTVRGSTATRQASCSPRSSEAFYCYSGT